LIGTNALCASDYVSSPQP